MIYMHIQRRYRPGFAPGSLFSVQPLDTDSTALEEKNVIQYWFLFYAFQVLLSTLTEQEKAGNYQKKHNNTKNNLRS